MRRPDRRRTGLFLKIGLSAFSRWGVPSPVAVRTGNFQVDCGVFRAAVRSGFRLSSNIAVPICRPLDESLALVGGKHWIGRIMELPVFCYNYRIFSKKMLRILCITACSRSEIISVLRKAREYELSPVIILTHPQEYIKKTNYRYTTLRRNRVNQLRLKALLEFLNENKDDFVTVPISAICDDATDTNPADRPEISVSSGMALARMLENGVNDRIWWY